MSSLSTASLTPSLPLFDPPVGAMSVHYPIVEMQSDDQADFSRFVQITTTVLWSGCVLVGVLGFILPYHRPTIAAPAPAPVVVEKLVVELANDPLPPAALLSDPLSTPPPPSTLVQPQIAQAIAVAEPSAVAFALPVEGPTTSVGADQAAHARPIVTPSAVAESLTPQTLIFGQGEGRQPAPEYPAHCVKLGQEGMVDIRLTVDSSGRVTETAVSSPCAWPLLNDAAERTVRHRWRFSQGPKRVYDVTIRFALAK